MYKKKQSCIICVFTIGVFYISLELSFNKDLTLVSKNKVNSCQKNSKQFIEKDPTLVFLLLTNVKYTRDTALIFPSFTLIY